MTEHKPWLSLPDEDPPERGLAELLAAARVKAEVMANPPWWKRLFAAMRRPPVLALATVVVLIGGVIVVGRHHDEAAPPAPSVDLPAGTLDTRARGAVDEAPPPPPPQDPGQGAVQQATVHQAPETPKKEAPVEKQLGRIEPLDLDAEQNAPATFDTKAADDGERKAPVVSKGGLKKAADPLARCRAAAAKRDCAAAKACVKDLGNVDVGNDAALRSCL